MRAYPAAGLVQGIEQQFLRDDRIRPGTSNEGTVFRISASGNYSNLYSLSPPTWLPVAPASPRAATAISARDDRIRRDPSNAPARFFPDQSQQQFYESLLVFPHGNEGAYPAAGLVQGLDGNFYGTTEYGGTSNGGTVFRISPSGSYSESVLLSPPTWLPVAQLVQGSDSNFYGTTEYGPGRATRPALSFEDQSQR